MISKLFQLSVSVFQDTVLRPEFFIAVGVILLLERLFPVDPKQPAFSAGLAHNGVWLLFAVPFDGVVIAFYARVLSNFYEAHLNFMTLKAAAHFPELARILFAIFLADFLAWFQHWVKHKVPWFWHFHAVHHSDRQLNAFTDFRFHFMEYFISRPIVMIPLLMFDVQVPHIVVFSLFQTWQTRFYHANIKSDLGFLRYLFVTPQSHRVHHSIERRHADKNFGVMFSFWDRFFKTGVSDHTVYPRTGIHDEKFPLEQAGFSSVAVSLLKQLAYPFVSIFRSLRHE